MLDNDENINVMFSKIIYPKIVPRVQYVEVCTWLQ